MPIMVPHPYHARYRPPEPSSAILAYPAPDVFSIAPLHCSARRRQSSARARNSCALDLLFTCSLIRSASLPSGWRVRMVPGSLRRMLANRCPCTP